MNILIADDERPACEELRFHLESLCREANIYEAGDGMEAMRLAEQNHFDVVFLDIDMAGANGLEVASFLTTLPAVPSIVFATAYSEYAVQAFDLAAADYLVKPFHERRLAATLERIRGRARTDPGPVTRLLSEKKFDKIWGETERGDKVLLEFDKIAYIEADRKRVFAVVQDGSRARLKPTLQELEETLGPKFLRVHKGYLVNLKFVGKVQRWYSGGFSLQLCDGPKSLIEVSRRYATRFKGSTGL